MHFALNSSVLLLCCLMIQDFKNITFSFSYDDPEVQAHRDESKCTVSIFLIFFDLVKNMDRLLLEGIP